MAQTRLPMRKFREILRLHYEQGLHAQQVGPDDRDDAVLLYIVEEVVPGVFVEGLCGIRRGGQGRHGE